MNTYGEETTFMQFAYKLLNKVLNKSTDKTIVYVMPLTLEKKNTSHPYVHLNCVNFCKPDLLGAISSTNPW
jgi:hypothetical protein